MKSCYVVLEDISCHYDAEKLKTLKPCPENTHVTSSSQNNEKNHLEEIVVRQPIAWCRMKDKRWSQLDNTVYSKLNTENTITERPHFLEKTIYDEALKLLSQKRKSPVRNLTFRSRRTKHCIELIVQKNTLPAQISATIDPQQSKKKFDHTAGGRSIVKNGGSTRKSRSHFIKILIRLEKIYFNQSHLYRFPQISHNWMLISLTVLKMTSTTFL